MNWTNRLLLIILFLSTCLLLADKLFSVDKTVQTDLKRSQQLLNLYKSNLLEQFHSESKTIDLNLEVTTLTREKTTLKSIIGNDTKLLLKISENYCNTCVEQELELVEILTKSSNSNNILILAEFSRFEKFYAFAKIKNLQTNIYFTDEPLDIPIDKSGTPYCFLISNDARLDLVFAPSKELPENSKLYYYTVFNDFFNERIEDILTD